MAPQKTSTPKSKRRSRPTSGDPLLEDSPHRSPRKRKPSSPEKHKALPVEKRRPSGGPKRTPKAARRKEEDDASQPSSNTLSLGALAKLDALNEKKHRATRDQVVRKERREKLVAGRGLKEKRKDHHRESGGEPGKRRHVSGPLLEQGRGRRGGYLNPEKKSKRKWWLLLGIVVLLLVILIPVGVVFVGKQNASATDSTVSNSPSPAAPANGNLNGLNASSIPSSAKGGYLDPFSWYDTIDFNVTYTDAKVGGLYVMGLNSTWDDSTRANQYVPPLNEAFNYGQVPIRGINVGGWLSIEPFITPSFFNTYDSHLGIVDEWTLTSHLGPTEAAKSLERHYSSFINRQSFADMQAAGFDHVRIPFSYWAVTTYPGDPYVPMISWRYLLRGIEYAREFGLRVNLDLHSVPGSQNGMNHSGRQGSIGWLNGTDGTTNGQRSLDIHNQISTFFAQPRYKNVIGLYGLVNEPKMTELPPDAVLTWTMKAINLIRKNGIAQTIVFGDGFFGLTHWQGKLAGISGLVMDAHQYVIFNVGQIAFPHQEKLAYACSGWTGQMQQSNNPATGYGPTLCGEWSQADTDCATYLNNVNTGNRWEGTLNLGSSSVTDLVPSCPPNSGTCECTDANADGSHYSDQYKQWLLMNAEAQMTSFEFGWGWFYWTWITESATQWSWKLGMEANILPAKVWDRTFNCTTPAPTIPGLPEYY